MHASSPRPSRRIAVTRLLIAASLGAALAAPAGAVESIEHGALGAYRVDREASGAFHVLRAATPVCTAEAAGSPEAAARAFLEREQALLGLPKELAGIERFQVQESQTRHHVRFRQQIAGVPVWRSAVAVHTDLAGCVVQVDVAYTVSGPVEGRLALGPDDALAFARAALVGAPLTDKFGTRPNDLKSVDEIELRGATEVTRTVFPAADARSGRAAWLVRLIASRPFGDYEAVIDAESGKVLDLRDTASYAVDGTGRTYEKVNACIAMQDATLRDQNDADAAVPMAAYNDVTLFQLNDPVGGQYVLTGPWVNIVQLENPNIPPPMSPAPSFIQTRNSDVFEPVLDYYHIDRTQRYIQSLGFDGVGLRGIMHHSVRVDSHGVNGADNSHYSDSPAGMGYLAFGDGGVDDGEDADVVNHEYGHAVHHNQVIGWGSTCEGGIL